MKDILFDSRSELDKIPFGSVKAGTKVIFGIRAAEKLSVKEMRIVVVNDSDKTTNEYILDRVWTTLGYTRFEGSVNFDSIGLFWYHFKIFSDIGELKIGKTFEGSAITYNEPIPWQLTVYSPDYTTPKWITGGAFYQIFVDRFCKVGERPLKSGAIKRSIWGDVPKYLPDPDGEVRCNDFFGGNLDGVIKKLPYLNELGINCIYLNPIFEAASNHKYDTADYMKIDASFGDESIFRTLCTEADKYDIKIICDGVFNHTGDDSIYFNKYGNYGSDGAYQSTFSPYYKWYNFFPWPDKYDSWWGIKTLPQIKKNSESFRKFITGENGVIKKWMSCGVYGWRLDVVDELSEVFIKELRKTVKSINPDAIIIGEVWEDASNKIAYDERKHYFHGSELDSVMNYPLRNAIINYIKTGYAEHIKNDVETICENYPKPALDCLMNILGTHDTVRILTLLSGKEYIDRNERANAKLSEYDRKKAKSLLKIATVLQCTLPGVPCIYYGDEAGVEGYEDPFCRVCYPWGNEDKELLIWYKKLLNIRKNFVVFAGGDYRTLRAEKGVYAYTRSKKGEKVLVVVNLGKEDVLVELSSPEDIMIWWNCNKYENSLRIFNEGCAIINITGA